MIFLNSAALYTYSMDHCQIGQPCKPFEDQMVDIAETSSHQHRMTSDSCCSAPTKCGGGAPTEQRLDHLHELFIDELGGSCRNFSISVEPEYVELFTRWLEKMHPDEFNCAHRVELGNVECGPIWQTVARYVNNRLQYALNKLVDEHANSDDYTLSRSKINEIINAMDDAQEQFELANRDTSST